MTENPVPFPTSPYCQVRARVATIWADGPDDDTHPDWRPATGEKVVLTSSIGSQLLTYDVGGADPIIVTVERVDCVVGADGFLTKSDGRPVYIAPTDDPLLSATGWTWTATIKGKSVVFSAPTGGVVDLALFVATPAVDAVERLSVAQVAAEYVALHHEELAGEPGPPNVLTKGTVTTGAPGSEADFSITGTAPEQVLNMTIPRGAPGENGQAPILLGKYVHSGNLVTQPTAVDLETGVFTCVGHGLTTGDIVRPRFNTIRNTPLLAVFPGGLTASENLTVTVLTPDTFTVGISSFTPVDTMDLSAWSFERFVSANNNYHRVTLAAPVTSCRIVSYGVNGTRYIKSDGIPDGTGSWIPSGVVTDRWGSVQLNTASEVLFFLECSARYVGNMVLLNGRKLIIGVGTETANTITNDTPMSNTVSVIPTDPMSFEWFAFNNGRVFNGNTIEVWDR